MKTDDMSTQRARRISRNLIALIDRCEIYPRRNTHVDSVSLALFARMAELHKSVCFLVDRGLRRDAVVLGRTLCEAAISFYWLTNKDIEERFDRYVKFWGLVRYETITRIEKHLGYRHVPTDKHEIELIEEAQSLFKKISYRWNEVGIRQMAEEDDAYERKPDGTPVNILDQYVIPYFLFSLLAHPLLACSKAWRDLCRNGANRLSSAKIMCSPRINR